MHPLLDFGDDKGLLISQSPRRVCYASSRLPTQASLPRSGVPITLTVTITVTITDETQRMSFRSSPCVWIKIKRP